MAQQIINNALQEWQQEIDKAKADLHPDEGGGCYIMSLTRRKQGIVGGVISKVYIDNAAKLIAGETHREATDDEIAGWNAEQAAKRQAQLAEAAKRETKLNLDLEPIAKLLLQMGMSMGNAQAAPTIAAQAPVAAQPPVSVPSASAPVVPPVATAPKRTAARTETTATDTF